MTPPAEPGHIIALFACMKRTRLFFFIALLAINCSLPTPVTAEVLYYLANFQTSEWTLSRSKIQCKLAHAIPGYGTATFFHSAGKDLSFQLVTYHPSERSEVAYLDAIPPSWNHRNFTRPVSSPTRMATHQPFSLQRTETLRLLYELEKGLQPTFTQTDAAEGTEPLYVGLSAIRFRTAYRYFQDCIASLLPFGFDDINFSLVHFETAKEELSEPAQKRLQQIAEYSLADRKVKKIVVHGHADWVGKETYNQTLSEKRSTEVVNYLIRQGIPKSMIQFESFGEKVPAETNRTEAGRQKNRRVKINVIRDDSADSLQPR